jgi:hyperosmotically inducible periplasmic protein
MRRWKLSKACAAIILAALAFVGCATWSSRESAGGYLDDAAITTKVKSSFVADPQVSALAINVQSSQGVVHLTGTANNEQERQRAIQIAQAVQGVKQVDARNLFVKG